MAVTVVATILYNLATRDLQDVKDALRTFKKEKWMDLGGILGVRDEVLEEVRADYTQKGVNQCLGEMLKSWLKKKTYKEARYGSPTWENLANAVEKSDDPALADTIREHHL